MPFSSELFDPTVREVLSILRPQTCLDIGAGAGKYGQLLRSILPSVRSIAVEIEQDYVSRFGLPGIYSEVWNIDAQALFQKPPDQVYDLVIFGDSIEHLRKSVGTDLLHFFYYRARILLVLYPIDFLQHSVEGYTSEAHISVWNSSDFAWCTHHHVRAGTNCFCIIKGLLDKEDLFRQCVSSIRRQEGIGKAPP